MNQESRSLYLIFVSYLLASLFMSSTCVKALRLGRINQHSSFSWTFARSTAPLPIRMSSQLSSISQENSITKVELQQEIPNRSMDEVFMKLALRSAQNAARKREVPIGAVLVDSSNTIVSTGKNSVEASHDATAHAEIECLRRGASVLGNWRLQECTLYTTLEPCVMCFAAIQSFRVKRVVFGARDHRLGACGSLIDLQSAARHPFHPQVEVEGGVMAEESKVLLKRFFQNRRSEVEEGRGYVFDDVK